jgi:hypothetical protein
MLLAVVIMGDSCTMYNIYLSVRVGSLVIKLYIMNRPLLSRLTSCGTASYARGIPYRLSVRVSIFLRGSNKLSSPLDLR